MVRLAETVVIAVDAWTTPQLPALSAAVRAWGVAGVVRSKPWMRMVFVLGSNVIVGAA